jgi:hypothetical protein
MASTMLFTLADRTLLLMLENKFEDTKGVSETINRRTDNTMAKRKNLQSKSTKHYTEN